MLKTAVKPKWIAALVFALAAAAVLVLLSQWQFNTSLQKDVAPPSVTEKIQPLLDTMEPGEAMLGNIEGQLVATSGHFDTTKQVLVPSRVQLGEVGYWVVTAFVVDGVTPLQGVAATKEVVIPVARGWVASTENIPAAPVGNITVEGRLLNSEGPVLTPDLPAGQISALASAELTNLWDVTTYAAFIVSHSEMLGGQDVGAATSAELTSITVTATDQNDKVNWLNIFYAAEWFIFAGFALFLWWRLVADDYRRDQDALFDIENDDVDDDSESSLDGGGPATAQHPA